MSKMQQASTSNQSNNAVELVPNREPNTMKCRVCLRSRSREVPFYLYDLCRRCDRQQFEAKLKSDKPEFEHPLPAGYCYRDYLSRIGLPARFYVKEAIVSTEQFTYCLRDNEGLYAHVLDCANIEQTRQYGRGRFGYLPQSTIFLFDEGIEYIWPFALKKVDFVLMAWHIYDADMENWEPHVVLFKADLKTRTIECLDSASERAAETRKVKGMSIFTRMIQRQGRRQGFAIEGRWKLVFQVNLPIQYTEGDCAIYVFAFVRYMLLNKDIDCETLRPAFIPFYRRQCAKTIKDSGVLNAADAVSIYWLTDRNEWKQRTVDEANAHFNELDVEEKDKLRLHRRNIRDAKQELKRVRQAIEDAEDAARRRRAHEEWGGDVGQGCVMI